MFVTPGILSRATDEYTAMLAKHDMPLLKNSCIYHNVPLLRMNSSSALVMASCGV